MTASSDPKGSGNLSSASNFVSQAVAALPPQYQELLKPGKTPDRIQHAITWAARRDPAVVAQHQARGHAVKQFEDIQHLPVRQLDKVAKHFARHYRHMALLTGTITGLPGGLWALIAASADVQLTAVYAVRMAADVAQSYGYDTSLVDEQAHLADVLALAAGIDSLRGVGNWLAREGLVQVLPELLPKLLLRLSLEITEEQAARWVGRLIPGVGAAVGGAIDYTFLRVAGERAIAYYHNRYLADHGLAPAPTPAALPTATPSSATAPKPPVVVEAASAPQPATPAPVPAHVAAPPKKYRRAPERFGIYLAIFAVFAMGITILACWAISALIVMGVQHIIH